MTVARYINSLDIINRAASECGITKNASAFSSTDPVFIQLIDLLNSCGQDLVGQYDWQQLIKEGSIATTGSPNRYAVPTDFSHFLSGTSWDSNGQNPVVGPLTPQLWTRATKSQLASAIYINYREAIDQFWLFPTDTVAGNTISYEYVRRTWVLGAGATYKDSVDASDDQVLFEPVLMVRMLKWKFLSARGFASEEAKSDFLVSFEAWKGRNKSAPVLNVSGYKTDSLIDPSQAGDTGFG